MAAERPRKRPRRTTEGNDTSGGKSKAQKATERPTSALYLYDSGAHEFVPDSLGNTSDGLTQIPKGLKIKFRHETGEEMTIGIEHGELVIRSDSFGKRIAVLPNVSNEIVVTLVNR